MTWLNLLTNFGMGFLGGIVGTLASIAFVDWRSGG